MRSVLSYLLDQNWTDGINHIPITIHNRFTFGFIEYLRIFGMKDINIRLRMTDIIRGFFEYDIFDERPHMGFVDF